MAPGDLEARLRAELTETQKERDQLKHALAHAHLEIDNYRAVNERPDGHRMWRVDLGFTAADPKQLMEFSQKIFPIARREGIGWEGGPCGPVTAPTPSFYGNCSKCGEARTEDYTCRDGGHTVPRDGTDA